MIEAETIAIAREIVRQPQIKWPAITIVIGAILHGINTLLDIILKIKKVKK